MGCLTLFLLAACSQQSTPGTPNQTSKIRPPAWIHGTWACDENRDLTACRKLAAALVPITQPVTFTAKDVRLKDPGSGISFVLYSDANYGITQSVTATVYTITVDAVVQKRIHTWEKTSFGLNYRFQASGNIELDLEAPLRRQ